jgi:hypothetical protein
MPSVCACAYSTLHLTSCSEQCQCNCCKVASAVGPKTSASQGGSPLGNEQVDIRAALAPVLDHILQPPLLVDNQRVLHSSRMQHRDL